MCLATELSDAFLEAGFAAKGLKTPSAQLLIEISQNSLDLWRRNEKALVRFARAALAGPTNLRATTGQLPELLANACWRLVSLLEYIASQLKQKAL